VSRILYLNIHDYSYPRNQRIRSRLECWGNEVITHSRKDYRSYVVTCITLLARALRIQGPFDVVFLSELAVQYTWVAKIVALRHRAPLVVDAFVGMYETNVEDWNRVPARSIRANLYRMFDWLAAQLSDLALIDTEVRTRRLRQDGATNTISCPVGAPDWAKPAPACKDSDTLSILYYGNYIPLHGLNYVVDNLVLLSDLNLDVTFIGGGEGRPPIEKQVQEAGLASIIKFLPGVPESDLIEHIHRADVVLGIFGDSEKAATVLANKVWQGLSSGRYVITRSSEALAEIQDLVGAQLIPIDIDTRDGLAKAVRQIVDSGTEAFPKAHLQLETYVEQKFADLRRTIDGLV
jgi:glycosyltransferase involved in cell wall biosynthesis